MAKKPKAKKPKAKKVEEVSEVETPIVPVPETEAPAEVAVGDSPEKIAFRAYMEELKRTDVHQYSVREGELLKTLNKLT